MSERPTMSEAHEPDDAAFAEAFGRAYHDTPQPEPDEARQAAAAAVSAHPPGSATPHGWLRPTVRLSPLAALAAALALFAGGAFVAYHLGVQPRRLPVPRAAGSRERVRFVFVDPTARRVTLAGDFNGWDAAATRLVRASGEDAWSVTIELTPGWHAYSFVVDGDRWVPDPQAPRAPEDSFGTPRSVIVVGEDGT